MKKLSKSTAILLAFMMAVLLFAVPNASAAEDLKVTVLSFNDFHGALGETGPTDKNMGAAKFSQAIKDLVAKDPKNTLLVSAGDNFNGTALSNLLYGKPVSAMFKELGVLASAVGNHEFDWGLDKLSQWSSDMGAPFLAANIIEKSSGKPVSWATPYKIVELDNKVKVAFIGLTTIETAYKTKPDNVKSLTFEDPVKSAEKYVDEVEKAGADIIILLTHIGTSQDPDTKEITFEKGCEGLTKIEGVDAIITAHSHQTVCGTVDGIPVVQAYYNGRTLAKLEFTVNPDTRAVSAIPTLDELYKRKAEIKDDPKVVTLMADFQKSVSGTLDEVIGNAEQAMPHSKEGLSALGQWTAKIMMEKVGYQIAVTNGGGLRTDIPSGKITMGKLYEVIPFDNVLSKFKVTGAQLKDIFEHGIENAEIGWIQYYGIKVEYVSGAPEGEKVVKMTLANGEEIKPDEKYTLVTNDFMATGGDGYTTFLAAEYIGDETAIRDAMVDAIKKTGKLEFTPEDLAVKVEKTAEPTTAAAIEPEDLSESTKELDTAA